MDRVTKVEMISVALLISTYNWPEALELVLQSVRSQSVLPTKLLIADDGSNERTRAVIEDFKKQINIPLEHVWHADEGFRKCIILNKAITRCECDYIVQIDGDVVLHPDFIVEHLSEAEPGFYIKGSRGLLSLDKTKELIRTKTINLSVMSNGLKNRINALHWPMLSFLFRRKSSRSSDLKGCNCAFWRLDFIKVNGYNNSLKGWGHEDIELAARLVNAGVMQKRIKLKAICFHLYHKVNDRSYEDANLKAYEKAVKEGTVESKNGYRQLIEE